MLNGRRDIGLVTRRRNELRSTKFESIPRSAQNIRRRSARIVCAVKQKKVCVCVDTSMKNLFNNNSPLPKQFVLSSITIRMVVSQNVPS